MNRGDKSKSIGERVPSRIDEESQHLPMFRTGDLHAAQIRLDHRQRIRRDSILFVPNDRVIPDHVAVAHTQKLRPQKAPNFFGNRVLQQAQNRRIHARARAREALRLLGKVLGLVEEQVVPQGATTGRIVEFVLVVRFC